MALQTMTGWGAPVCAECADEAISCPACGALVGFVAKGGECACGAPRYVLRGLALVIVPPPAPEEP